MTIDDALQILSDRGATIVTAQQVACVLWPTARHNNANGQTFNLASGVAGRMLRRCLAAHEVRPRVWEIVTARLKTPNV